MNVATILNDLFLRQVDIEKAAASGDRITKWLLAIEAEELKNQLERELLWSAVEPYKRLHN